MVFYVLVLLFFNSIGANNRSDDAKLCTNTLKETSFDRNIYRQAIEIPYPSLLTLNVKVVLVRSLIDLSLVDLVALAVRTGSVVALVDDEVLGVVVVAARQVAVDDGLGTGGVPLLGVNRGTRHVGNHGVAATPWVLGRPQRVVPRRGLREPHVTTVAAQVTRLKRIRNVLLDNDGTTGSVDQPRS